MKELLTYIAKHLVDNPDEVSVTETMRGDDLLLELRVAPDDMGKVIGRQGRTSREIRTIMKSAGMRENRRVSVEIVD
ncbi:KH domain-containing protein [Oscillospiraceae bacterium OttesenSCG-928-G22]|nr:KH domain-containing protein [Oscillospiraceae bacterium OttesenSCG-928-G22]